MAEKEETEGRCPACRTRYDKDRIVKMTATCERSVTNCQQSCFLSPLCVLPDYLGLSFYHRKHVNVILPAFISFQLN
jgi:hypothetical protein